LIDLLERGEINGALVSRLTSQDGRIRAVTTLARTRQEFFQHGGSSYVDTPVLQKMKQVMNEPGRIAVVALPCQARAFQSLLVRDAQLRQKFFPVIGLFCRGNITEKFYEDYFNRLSINQAEVESVRVKRGHLEGDVLIHMRDGSQRVVPFMAINSYRLAGIHPKALCAWCDEHTAEAADIAVGDIFMKQFKQREIKYSAFTAHTPEAKALLQDLEQRRVISAEYVGWEPYKKVFRRVEKFSDTLASRCLAARITGVSSPKPDAKEKTNYFHTLAWLILFQNKKLSDSESGRRFLFTLPAPVISAIAYLVKGLSRL